jgi:hypothetical protein
MNEQDRIASLLGASMPIKLADGSVHAFKPLNLGEVEECVRWLRYQKLRDVIEATRGADPQVQTRLIDRAYEECSQMSSEEVMGGMKSLAGIRYALFLSLRREHPGIQLERVFDLVTMDNFIGVKKQMEVAAGEADPT